MAILGLLNVLQKIMNKRRLVILKSIFFFGILPSLVFNLSRFGVRYWFELGQFDIDFVGTSVGSTIVFLLIGYFVGRRFYSRTQKSIR